MKKYGLRSDLELAFLLKKEDEKAYQEIYLRYWPLLFRFVRKMLQDDQQAMDVIQDVFTTLWVNSSAFELNSSLSAYLYRAVRNRALNVISNGKLRKKYLESLQGFINKGEWVTDETVRLNELSVQIENEIAKLPPKMREIFELRRSAGLSYKQIAIQLGVGDETVKTQVSRALKLLRSKLGSELILLFI